MSLNTPKEATVPRGTLPTESSVSVPSALASAMEDSLAKRLGDAENLDGVRLDLVFRAHRVVLGMEEGPSPAELAACLLKRAVRAAASRQALYPS